MNPRTVSRNKYNTARRIHGLIQTPHMGYLIELSTKEELAELVKFIQADDEVKIMLWAKMHRKRVLNIETMGKNELLQLASALRVPYYSHKSKEELFSIVKELLKW